MKIAGKIKADIFHNGKLLRTTSSTSVSGDSNHFQSTDSATRTSVLMSFVPAIEDGTTTYKFEEADSRFGCSMGDMLLPVAGTVEVTSANSTDNLKYTFSGKFNDGRRDLEIKGTAELNYLYP